eukprot:gene53586-71614_t
MVVRAKSASLPAEMVGATMSEYDGVRFLHLDSIWVQGAMRLAKPQALELEYIQRMMAWLLFVEPASVADRQALQLGLGAASLTKFCHKELRIKTAAIELTRSNRDSLCVALHPGTVDTPLSQPFAKTGLTVRPPQEAAADLLGSVQEDGDRFGAVGA